jgi:hypothetical protein
MTLWCFVDSKRDTLQEALLCSIQQSPAISPCAQCLWPPDQLLSDMPALKYARCCWHMITYLKRNWINLQKIQDPLKSRCRPFCFDVPFLSLNTSIAKLIKTIQSRLIEINVEIDESKLRQIVVMKFPDYRAIANDIEFELL